MARQPVMGITDVREAIAWQAGHADRADAPITGRIVRAELAILDTDTELARRMPENLVVELASLNGNPVACAILLRGAGTLYGRYWGAAEAFHSLHFELCYYRGIEYCIREGLARFEPGTQGEHKLLRGFLPTPVWSMHEVADPRFAAAIGDWLRRERDDRRAWLREAAMHLPFRHRVGMGVDDEAAVALPTQHLDQVGAGGA